MRPGDVCWVPRHSTHSLRNEGSAVAVLMLCYSAARREYRAN
jgi:mannose-6-phosphate isomerase-like protein (cupin superfamily)